MEVLGSCRGGLTGAADVAAERGAQRSREQSFLRICVDHDLLTGSECLARQRRRGRAEIHVLRVDEAMKAAVSQNAERTRNIRTGPRGPIYPLVSYTKVTDVGFKARCGESIKF